MCRQCSSSIPTQYLSSHNTHNLRELISTLHAPSSTPISSALNQSSTHTYSEESLHNRMLSPQHFCSKLDHTAVGIQHKVREMARLISEKDPELGRFLQKTKVSPTFYGFRWITLMMTQVLPTCLTPPFTSSTLPYIYSHRSLICRMSCGSGTPSSPIREGSRT